MQQQHQQHNNNDINRNYKKTLIEQEAIKADDSRINYSTNRAQVHGSRHVVNMLGKHHHHDEKQLNHLNFKLRQ
jgi:hypothetical protein